MFAISNRQVLLLLIAAGLSLPVKLRNRREAAEKLETSAQISISPAIYPTARRDETVVDNFSGTKVVDPYRWLEDLDAPETRQFISELNVISKAFLAKSPNRRDIWKKLNELSNHEVYGCPSKHGRFYYYGHNTGLKHQDVVYRQTSLKDKEKAEVFLDPNSMSVDGTTSISLLAWTEDGSTLAYGVNEKGSDWVTVRFRGANKEDIADVIERVKLSELAWLSDNSGIFYSTYPPLKTTEGKSTEKHEYHSLYFHRMGTNCSEDVLVYDKRERPDYVM
ncbi:hypothetical protein Y032_0349g3204 [Ancylostoma ceylanicum]|uniref:Peptidase S9A N-terminal domain-containing protein n=1 Tax=Ancylostoma ceylanicum TaxID=53326 RepID=A0A016RXZ6_9BILA|nr:hypothetical protein Y032_0349g3204 [Ancylostoma ceylanicum]